MPRRLEPARQRRQRQRDDEIDRRDEEVRLPVARVRAGDGARKGLLGTTRRRNGKLQVTYAGHPLYYYKDDSPGRILCHNVEEFGGLWLVVKPNGSAVS